MKELKIDVLYSENVVVWDNIILPVQKIQNGNWTDLNLLGQEDPESIKENPYVSVEYLTPITKMLIWNRRLIN